MSALDGFIGALAEHTAHEHGWSLEDATRWIEIHIIVAWEEYRQKGAPLGDTDEEFLARLSARHQPSAA